ncbi:MAG: urease accessory protein UreD [Akkermansiaceae bacterium]
MSRRRAGGLCSVSKPYWDRGCKVLGLQLVNPTAGLFSGDRLGMDVIIGPRAQVAMTSPSATRFHTMPKGQAVVSQNFHIAGEAWLDFWPEILIPQKDSDVVQVTKIHLEDTASMVYFDSLAPGRLAHKENFQFRRLETRLEIMQGDELVAKERCVLSPETGKWPLQVPDWKACYYGAIWIAGPRAEQVILDIQSDGFIDEVSRYGASLLSPKLGVLRIISPSSLLMKRAADHFRGIMKNRLPLLQMDFRKI